MDLPVEGGVSGREEATFLGETGELFLSFQYLPDRPALGCVIICPSLYQDAFATYRQEGVLARELVGTGIAAARLHYRGVGNSDDPPNGIATAATMAADIEVVVRHLEQRCEFATGEPRLGFVAAGYGAIAGSLVAARHPGAPMVLWSPAVSGRQYYRDLFRAGKLAAARGVDPETAEASLVDAMRERGQVEVMGQLVHTSAFEDAEPRSLVDQLGDTPRDLFLAQMSFSERLDRQYERLIDDWRARGFPVDVAVFKQQGAWWFVEEEWVGDEYDPVYSDFLRDVKGWFVSRWGADRER